ncbi:MAG: YfiR family protein [Nitrospirae bacterium]|nr:YfiR family protein [Nitrospirota bacterium]
MTNRPRAAARRYSCIESVVLSALCITLAFGVAAQVEAEPLEYNVKAAFIYNFAKFVEWPEDLSKGDSPFVIGILGEDPFGNVLDETVSHKTVREKRIVVKRFSRSEDAKDCQLLFISRSGKEDIAQIVKRLGHAPVLTISDVGQFTDQGGMIQLVMDQNRVRFAINVAATEQAGLKPSSQLLKLARIVTKP